MIDDAEDQARFAARFQDELLTRVSHWAEPLRIDRRRRPPTPGPGWRLVPVLVVLAAVALFTSPFVVRPRAPSGAYVLRRAWPAGFTGKVHLLVSSGRIILYEGNHITAFRTDSLTRSVWRTTLAASGRILGAWMSPGDRTLVAVRSQHRLAVIVLGPAGQQIGTTRLAPTLKSSAVAPASQGRRLPVPRRVVWIRSGPTGGFVLSDRSVTYVLSAQGRVLALVAGGNGSLLMTNAAGQPVIVSYETGRYAVSISTLKGAAIYSFPEPMAAFPSLMHGAYLVPIRYGSGVVLETPHALLTLSQDGLNATSACPRGPTSGDAHLVNTSRGTRLVVWGPWLDLRLPLLAGYRGLGILDPSGVVLAARPGTIYALRPDGRILAAASGVPGSVGVGTRYAFVATAQGLVRLGPFPPPRLPSALSWSGASGPWRVTATVRPLTLDAPYLASVRDVVTGPLGQSYAALYRSTGYSFPADSNLAATLSAVFPGHPPQPLAARVTVVYTGRDPGQFTRVGSSAPPWWGNGTRAPGYETGNEVAGFSRPSLLWPHARPGFTRTLYLADNPLAWMAVATGWAPLPHQFSWYLSYRVAGRREREQLAVTLTEEQHGQRAP